MNNKISTILHAALLIAVIVLFVLVLGNRGNKGNNARVSENDSLISQHLPVAYVNIDSLLLNYEFAKESNEALLKKQEDSRATLNAKAKRLQAKMEDFQRKLQNQAFLSRERAEKAQSDIVKEQQKLQETETRLTQKIMEEQQKMSEQLRDTIYNFLKIYNEENKYELIISNTANDNVLFADKSYDITDDIIEQLNKRYKKK